MMQDDKKTSPSAPQGAQVDSSSSSTQKPFDPLETVRHISEEIKSLVAPPFLKISLSRLVWLFFLGSIVGLYGETLFHFIVYGTWESRVGLVYGPFSPIYGLAAVFVTLALNRLYYTHGLVIFLVSMVLGSFLEFGTSWIMEYGFHAIAWDYTGTFGSIGGRTNFLFGMMWGLFGLIWTRFFMPLFRFGDKIVNWNSVVVKTVSALLMVVLLCDITLTLASSFRQGQRAEGIPATNPIASFLDEYYPDEYLNSIYQNITVASDLSDKKQAKSTSDLIIPDAEDKPEGESDTAG